ncbi:hypothetical protein B0T25DRAFT_550516 [Lasiosphaeria hispida]|uniref:ATPase AAA-type core domain-containing protein n=1 Tax=Lasiosphaeria hispida TaxID=260671 RepID=A0AAJ0MA82_9PEZI|nr:hypothetical protein B0T25DRAFT_550516 [Lasiosphaeria hispida]
MFLGGMRYSFLMKPMCSLCAGAVASRRMARSQASFPCYPLAFREQSMPQSHRTLLRLVSSDKPPVFLRLLESQSSIIFLTTNLVDIDDALHSRIQSSISYSELNDTKRTAIRRDLARDRCGCELTDAEAAALRKLPVDGRTIKNVLRLHCTQPPAARRRVCASVALSPSCCCYWWLWLGSSAGETGAG